MFLHKATCTSYAYKGNNLQSRPVLIANVSQVLLGTSGLPASMLEWSTYSPPTQVHAINWACDFMLTRTHTCAVRQH